jgi:hypothetical protein
VQSTPAVPQATRPRPGPWTWAVAASPLLTLGIAVIGALFTNPGGNLSGLVTISWLAGGIFAFIAARMDVRAMRRAGDPAHARLSFICILLSGWAYLLARAIKRRTGADWGVFAACAAATVLVLAIVTPVAATVQTANMTFNQAKAQSDIAAWIKTNSGYTVTVACPPDPSMTVGTKLTCIATAADGSTTPVDVTVQDNSGDITWQVGGGS